MSEKIPVIDSAGSRLLKALVTELKLQSPRFGSMDVEKQQEVIDRLRLQVVDVVKDAVGEIAARSYVAVPGKILKLQFKDEVQAVVEMNRTNKSIYEVAAGVGGQCMIVLCDLDQFTGGMETAVKPVSPQRDWTDPDNDD